MVKLRVSYPRPHVLDLSSDHRVHRILVPVPVLTASVNHSTIGTFDDIPVQTEVLTKTRTLGDFKRTLKVTATYPDQAYLARPIHGESEEAEVFGTTMTSFPPS